MFKIGTSLIGLCLVLAFQNCSQKTGFGEFTQASASDGATAGNDSTSQTVSPKESLILQAFRLSDVTQLSLSLEGYFSAPGSYRHRIDMQFDHQAKSIQVRFVQWNPSLVQPLESNECETQNLSSTDYSAIAASLYELQLENGQQAMGADGGELHMELTALGKKSDFRFKSAFADQSQIQVITHDSSFSNLVSSLRGKACGLMEL